MREREGEKGESVCEREAKRKWVGGWECDCVLVMRRCVALES